MTSANVGRRAHPILDAEGARAVLTHAADREVAARAFARLDGVQ